MTTKKRGKGVKVTELPEGLKPSEGAPEPVKQTRRKSRKLSTPTGITLNDIVSDLKEQTIEVLEEKLEEVVEAVEEVTTKKIRKKKLEVNAKEKKPSKASVARRKAREKKKKNIGVDKFVVDAKEKKEKKPRGMEKFEVSGKERKNRGIEKFDVDSKPKNRGLDEFLVDSSASPAPVEASKQEPAPQPEPPAEKPASPVSPPKEEKPKQPQSRPGEVSPHKQSVNKKSKKKSNIRHVLLKSIFGKQLTKKIEKSFFEEGRSSGGLSAPQKKASSYAKDIQQIKEDVAEIKTYLVKIDPKQAKVVSTPLKQSRGNIIKSMFSQRIKEALARIKAQRIQKPTPASTAERVPQENVVTEASAQLMRERAPSTNIVPIRPAETFSGTAVEENQSQAAAAQTKKEATESDRDKRINEKLDKVIELLEKLTKRKSGPGFNLGLGLAPLLSLMKRVLAGVAAGGVLLKKLWSKLGNVWERVKNFALTGARAIGSKLGTVARTSARIASKFAGPALAAASITAEGVNAIGNTIPDHLLKKNMKPVDELEKKYGLISGAKSGKMGKWSTDGGRTFVAYKDLPETHRKLIDANVGDKRTYSAKQAQKYIREHQEEFRKLEVPAKREAQPKMEEKRIPQPAVSKSQAVVPAKKLPEISSTNQELKTTQKTVLQPIVVKQKTQKVVQAPQQSERPVVVKTRNSEPSLDRYNGSIFDHPAGYYNLYKA